MKKEEFIKTKIEELKEIMYKDDPGLMTPEEEEILQRFLEKFINDLKEAAR